MPQVSCQDLDVFQGARGKGFGFHTLNTRGHGDLFQCVYVGGGQMVIYVYLQRLGFVTLTIPR